MKPVLADFHAGVDQLVVFLSRTEREQELIALLNTRKDALPEREATLLGDLIASSTNAKQYIYAVAIVSLYGLLERLVDGLINGFVAHLGDFSGSYDDLPEVIRDNHLPQSLALAEAMLKDRFRGETTHQQLIANLHSCLSGEKGYKLNGSAFALHRGNVNLGRISEMLKGIGAQHHLQRVVRTPAFLALLKKLDAERQLQVMGDEGSRKLLEPIDDLVERRNDISHGVVQVADIESVGLLKERSDFVRAYGTGLYEMLLQNALKYAAEIGVAQPLGTPIEVYNKTIVCFEANCRITVGDYIFAITGDAAEPVRYSALDSLEIDRVRQEEIVSTSPVKFGAKVLFHANKRYNYFSLPAERL